MCLELVIAWVMDLLMGDPVWLPHPVVYMGKWIAWLERLFNKGSHRKLKGAALAVVSIALILVLSHAVLVGFQYSVLFILSSSPLTAITVAVVLTFLLYSFLAFFCLAGHTLRKEVRMVFEAVERGLDEGRKQVARIVGRDTQELSEQEVRTAALETLAENLSDGVVAPLFWFALLGLPGMLAYKMVNTLDSMIGYHSPRYKDFGCWAARIDDVTNYIPARITAFLMIVYGWLYSRILPTKINGGAPLSLKHLFRFVLCFGPQHASPNSGWPEASLAGILNCQFGGSHNYFGEVFHKPHIGSNPRPLTTNDMKTSLSICFYAECMAVALTSVVSFVNPWVMKTLSVSDCWESIMMLF